MAKGKEIFNKILEEMEAVKENGDKFYNENNKSAGARLRKALMNITKLNKAWRKEVI